MQAIIGGIIAGFGAVWQWAVTWRRSLPVFLSSRSCLVLCHRHCHWFMVWRALYLLPIFRIPVKMQKVSAASPLRKNRIRRGVVFVSGCWSFSDAGLGAAHGDEPTKTGAGNAFGVGFGLLIERAQICFTSAFAICGSPDVPIWRKQSLSVWRECHRDLQLRTVRC